MRNYKAEIEVVNNHIKNFKEILQETEQEYIDSLDNFNEKFKAWWESSLGDSHPYLPRNPYIRKWIDKWDWERYRTIDIHDYIDDFYCIIYPEKLEYNDWYSEEDHEEMILIAKELMENNMKSFTIDW